MGIRRACWWSLIGLALSGALSAPAGASERVLAHWTVTISGSVRHSWTLTDREPCHATGDGFVTAQFASSHPERITIADNGYGPGDTTWNDFFHVRGTTHVVDNRTRNPPPPDGVCDSGPVPDKRGCGTRHFHSSGFLVGEPLPPERYGYDLSGAGLITPWFNTPRNVQDCERDGFNDFTYIGDGNSRAEAVKLPGYPSAAALARRHGRIVVTASDHHRWVPTALTVRHVRIVFTRVG